MQAGVSPNHFRRLVWLGLAIILANVACVALTLRWPLPSLWGNDLLTTVAAALAGGYGIRRGLQGRGRVSTAWLLLGAASSFWALGNAVWSIDELIVQAGLPVDQREVPFPGLADIGYAGFSVFAFAGLLILPSLLWTGRARLRILLDGLLLLGGVFAVAWWALLEQTFQGGGVDALATALGLGYPTADVVLTVLAVLGGAYAAHSQRRSRLLLLAGLLSLSIGDFGFWLLDFHGLYASGSWIDPAWTTGFVVLAWAAAVPRVMATTHRLGAAEHPSWFVRWLPLMPTNLASAALIGYANERQSVSLVLTVTWISVLVLAILREVSWRSEARHFVAKSEAEPTPTPPPAPAAARPQERKDWKPGDFVALPDHLRKK